MDQPYSDRIIAAVVAAVESTVGSGARARPSRTRASDTGLFAGPPSGRCVRLAGRWSRRRGPAHPRTTAISWA